jgi:hypothetical protein
VAETRSQLPPEGVLTCVEIVYAICRELDVAVSVCIAGVTVFVGAVKTSDGGLTTNAGLSEMV